MLLRRSVNAHSGSPNGRNLKNGLKYLKKLLICYPLGRVLRGMDVYMCAVKWRSWKVPSRSGSEHLYRHAKRKKKGNIALKNLYGLVCAAIYFLVNPTLKNRELLLQEMCTVSWFLPLITLWRPRADRRHWKEWFLSTMAKNYKKLHLHLHLHAGPLTNPDYRTTYFIAEHVEDMTGEIQYLQRLFFKTSVKPVDAWENVVSKKFNLHLFLSYDLWHTRNIWLLCTLSRGCSASMENLNFAKRGHGE